MTEILLNRLNSSNQRNSILKHINGRLLSAIGTGNIVDCVCKFLANLKLHRVNKPIKWNEVILNTLSYYVYAGVICITSLFQSLIQTSISGYSPNLSSF